MAHHIMCRTPSHLEIIVKESFTEIGLGVARNAQGYIYITQLFSDPVNKLSASKDAISSLASPLGTFLSNCLVMALPSTSDMILKTETPVTSLTFSQTDSLKNEVKDWILKTYPVVKEDPILSGVVMRWLCSKS